MKRLFRSLARFGHENINYPNTVDNYSATKESGYASDIQAIKQRFIGQNITLNNLEPTKTVSDDVDQS